MVTQRDTEKLMISITVELEDDVLIDLKVLTSGKIYLGVNGHYLSGCSGYSMMMDNKLLKVPAMALDEFWQTNKRGLSHGLPN